jgi:hypothetical protein
MQLRNRLRTTSVTPTESQVRQLRTTADTWHTVELHPPETDLPAALPELIDGIREKQTKWMGVRNTSPVIAFELRRPRDDRLRLQVAVPTKRLERKLRTQLAYAVPNVGFDTPGTDGLPVTTDTTIGGGWLTTTRRDWHRLRTDHDTPPMSSVVSGLHRHAMRDIQVVIQLLFRAVAGHRLRRRYRRWQADREIGYLRGKKERLWGRRPATAGERHQATAIEETIRQPQFDVSLRLLVIGAGDHTRNRIKELTGGFNTFDNHATGQSLRTIPARSIRTQPVVRFCNAVVDRQFERRYQFRLSRDELAAFVALPSHHQQNIQYAQP